MGDEIKEIKVEVEVEVEDAKKELADEIADLDFSDTPDVVVDASKVVEEVKKPIENIKEISDGEKKEEEIKTVVKEETVKEVQKEDEVDKTVSKVSDEKKSESEPDQITRLLAEIDRLSGMVKVESASVKDVDAEKLTEKDILYDFIKDIDMDDVASDPKVLNKILNEVILRTQQLTTEQVLRSIPQVVMSQVQQQTYLKRTADKFYEDNPDLVNVKQVVRACAQQVQKDNPEWEVDKVFKETAIKTRQTLGISARVINIDDKIASVEDVAFVKASGGHKSNLNPKKSSRQTEIDEL